MAGIYVRTKEIRARISESCKRSGVGKWALGAKRPEESVRRSAEARSGDKSVDWKGDKAGYRAIHAWVQRKLGKASLCSGCGKVGTGKQIHWANIDHKYKRILADWLQLCAYCHSKHDKGLKLRRGKTNGH